MALGLTRLAASDRGHAAEGTDALRALRGRRRSRRLAGFDRFDAFYQAYITALFAGVAVLAGSTYVGSGAIAESTSDRIASDGPAVLGLVVAVALLLALRSGSRGGPMAVEAPDVQHVLLSPVDRGVAVAGPALRQLRFAAFAAVVAGLVAGQLAGRRLDGGVIPWAISGAGFALVLVGLAVGVAWIAAGRRLHRHLATVLGLVVVGWALGDLAGAAPEAPTSFVGEIGLWPLELDGWALLALPLALVLLLVGLRGLGGVSLEDARTRSALVGELRFAATMRDLRTVIVLRRRLAQERPRPRPWLPAGRLGGHTVVARRGWRALDRTPAGRLLRMGALGVIAALAAVAVYDGAAAMVVVSGLAAYVAGLDAVEPLAQEVDHPTVLELTPVDEGAVMLRHLLVPALTMVGVALVGLLAVLATQPTGEGLAVAAVAIVPAALAGTAGAAISTLKDAKSDEGQSDLALMVPPEAAGARVLYQAVWPPAVATAGFIPVLVAGIAARGGDPAVDAALTATFFVLLLVGLVAGWVRMRADIRAWMRQAMEQPQGGR